MNLKLLIAHVNRRLARFRPAKPPVDPMAAYLGLRPGINLSNALEAPREGLWGITLAKDFFPTIRNAGFSSIRVPICWPAHASEKSPYRIEAAFWKRVDWVIAQAKANHLHAILDFQNYEELIEDPAGHEERFVALWRQIAERYQHEPPTILFELFNEPHGNLDAATWNRIIPKALAVIRPTNPTRLVVVGPTSWNDIGALPSLVLPDDDPYLAATVHFYRPTEFTHQGADWVSGSSQWLGATWQGTETEKKAVEDAMNQAAAWGRTHHRPIFLGEFGVYNKADQASRRRWTEHVARSAEACGIAWAYWEFCSGFGAYDPETKKWRMDLLNALIQDSLLSQRARSK